MPSKRKAINQSIISSQKIRALRAAESDEQRALTLESLRGHDAEIRSSESPERRQVRLRNARVRTTQTRSSETPEQRERMLQVDRIGTARSRQALHADLYLCTFHYDSNVTYSLHPSVVIGKLIKTCTHCNALKFKNETPGMFCASGKVKLPELLLPPSHY